MEWVLMVLGILLITLLAIGWHYSGVAFSPRVYSHEAAYQNEISAGRLSKEEFEGVPRQEVIFRSTFGYPLFGYFFRTPGSTRTVILCHGYTYNLYGSIKFMDLFLNRGFNVLMYDHRFHGRSGGRYTTFGYYEKIDLKTCVDWVLSTVGEDSLVGTHGESLGAGVVLQHAALDDRIAFAIADSGYSDLDQLLRLRLREDFHLPEFPIYPLAMLTARLRCGIQVSQVSPIRMLKAVETPIMLIHGENDGLIPCKMSQELFEQKPDTRRFYRVPGARHAETYWIDRAAYDSQVENFLEKFLIRTQPGYSEPG